jgi:hypothetical protein
MRNIQTLVLKNWENCFNMGEYLATCSVCKHWEPDWNATWRGTVNGVITQGFCTQEDVCNKCKLSRVGKMNNMLACRYFDEKEHTSIIITQERNMGLNNILKT